MKSKSMSGNQWWKKLGWLVLIWTASVISLGAVALVMRLLMRAAGLST